MLRKALSIRYILLAAFLLAGLVPASIMTWMAFSTARDALEAEIARDMQARATATVGEIDRMMFERLQNVASWSALEVMQELRLGDVDKRLSRFLGELKASYRGVYAELHVVNGSRHIVASSEPLRLGQAFVPVGNGPGVELAQGDVRAMGLVADRLPLAAKITDTVQGGDIGILYAVFDWGQVRQVLETAASGGGAAAVYDRRGRVLAATSRWSDDVAENQIAAAAETRSYQGFSGLGWKVVVAQPKSEALAPVHEMARTFLLLLLFTIVIAALVAVPVASGMARPLARLTDFARNFISQQRSVPPPTGGPSEVRELSAAFKQMIQDLEQLKDNLTHAAKLAMVGEMAAALTHEVRTPLGILRSSAQLLLREPQLSEEGREVCGFIVSETERMNRLITTLLDSARARAPELAPVDLAALSRQVTAMLVAQAGKKQIALVCTEPPAGTQTLASCDAEQITQVLLNLVLNALQILPERGRVEVAVRGEPDVVVLEVADDGPGIAAELYDRVFDPFFTRRSGGIGLGLAVVRQIVAAHQGTIVAARSHLGGALFRLTLPSAAKTETA